ncbi:hypothetical protein HYPSUDRAFT_915560 [Hypholoma sublateritium FD-334 SS-4]|uniref:Uncharacterized protein n=1 Tax=Hypholoma sublateritium (strain FD-334 SS-4) TaxID=945553 RepID=A0A0D2NPP7_HYPSF|nr:hypothetical protein HYPSUDRAFT_915560 [Hypholoma sublateritium FD-334 SS-4]
MFTTPKKATKFRPHPYKTPTRPSPGGHMHPPSSPFGSPINTSPFARSPPPDFVAYSPFRQHRVGVREIRSQTPLRKPPANPGRFSSLPAHLQPNPTLNALIEESAQAVQNAQVPLTPEDSIYWKELAKLGAANKFQNALCEAREEISRGVRDAPLVNAQIDAATEYRSPRKADLLRERREAIAARQAEMEVLRERSVSPTPRRHSPRKRKEEESKPSKKHQRHERQRRAEAARRVSEELQTPTPAPSPPRVPTIPPVLPVAEPTPMEAEAVEDTAAAEAHRKEEEAERAWRVAEKEAEEKARAQYLAALQAEQAEQAHRAAAQRAEEEAQLQRLKAMNEEARLQTLKAEQTRKLAEQERVLADMERAQAAKTQRRAEEWLAKVAEERVQAEAIRKQAEQEYLRAQREQEERIQSQRKADLLSAQRKAEEEAQRQAAFREEAARIQAERDDFFRQKAEIEQIFNLAETTYIERMARLAEIERAEAVLEANFRARMEEMQYFANHPRNPLAEHYRQQAAQRAAEEEFQRQSQQQHRQQQHRQQEQEQEYQHYQQQHHKQQEPENHAPDAHYTETRDVPMRDSSFMTASKHSVHEEVPRTEYQETPAPSYSPPSSVPLTGSDFFANWEAKWKCMQSETDLSSLHFSQLPWPVLCHVTGINDITTDRLLDFLNHPDCPRALVQKKVIARYHSDRFDTRVTRKLHPTQKDVVAQMAEHCTVLLVQLMRRR